MKVNSQTVETLFSCYSSPSIFLIRFPEAVGTFRFPEAVGTFRPIFKLLGVTEVRGEKSVKLTIN